MTGSRSIALVAHDNKKQTLISWVLKHIDVLRQCRIVTTGTTGKLIHGETGLQVHCVKSGPLGGDQQIGAQIAEGEIDYLVFFWDPLASMSHDSDIKALLRIATVWNVPTACNQSSADLMVSNPAFFEYAPLKPDYESYLNRAL